MVCNDVKYYPEKDADSYYARPRSESFNPMTSLSFSLSLSLSLRIPTPVGKCWPVISIANLLRAVFKGRGAAERSSEKKEYLLLAISFFVSICVLLPRDKPTPRSFFFFFSSFLSGLDLSMSLLREIINCTIGTRYEFINLRQGWRSLHR